MEADPVSLRDFVQFGGNFGRVTGITEQLVDCSGGEDFSLEGATKRKLAAVWALLQQHNVARTIIFCNKIDTCRATENFLARQDRRAGEYVLLPHHAAISAERRLENLRAFLTPPKDGQPRRVLVCTDRCDESLLLPISHNLSCTTF
jgi:ATP-dependent RNA helicase DDX18/HAS1